MKILVGLGNPGKKYYATRHNVGFRVIERVALWHNISFKNSFTLKASYSYLEMEKLKVALVKPLTYMNRSGYCIKRCIEKFQCSLSDMLIVLDDIDLELGVIRYRTRGRSAGHNGMQSVIDALGTDKIPRLKIGIGRPISQEEVIPYVLGEFKKEDFTLVDEMIVTAAHKCVQWLKKESKDAPVVFPRGS